MQVPNLPPLLQTLKSEAAKSPINAAATFQALQQATPQERQEHIDQLAQHVLYVENEGKPYVTLEFKQFPLILASTTLKGSPYESTSSEKSMFYLKVLLDHWEKGVAKVIDPGLSPKEVQFLHQSLQDCIDFNDFYKSKQNPSKLIQLIQSKLSLKQYCYLPTGWIGGPGHFMLARFSEGQDVIHAELLTKGAGMEYHAPSFASKRMHSYHSQMFTFSKSALFQSELGISFFARLMNINNPAYEFLNKSQALDEKDLYGLFRLMEKMTKPNKPDLQQIRTMIPPPMTTQRAGNCGDSAFRTLFYDAVYLLAQPGDTVTHKKCMFAFKFQILVDGFRQFREQMQKGNMEIAYYLRHAVKEHFGRASKLYPEWLNDDEFLLSYSIGNKILQEVTEAEESFKEKNAI